METISDFTFVFLLVSDDCNPVDAFKVKLKQMDNHLMVIKEHSEALPQLQTGNTSSKIYF